MKRAFILISCAALVFTAWAGTVGALICDEPVYDFGRVADTVLVTHVFVLRNRGSQPVRIERVQPACGCTSVGLSANEIAPGGTVDLTATVSLRGRSGAQRFTVRVYSTDTVSPIMTLVALGTVAEDIRVSPPRVAFAKTRVGEMAKALVTLESAGAESFSITAAESSDPRISIDVTNALPGRLFLLNLTVDPVTIDGEFRGEVTVHTDHPRRPLIVIPVSLFTKPTVVVRPTVLAVSMEMEALSQQQVISVFSPDSQPFRIDDIVKPDPAMEVVIRPVTSGRYDVEVGNITPGPALASPLLIKTSLGITISVPFRMQD